MTNRRGRKRRRIVILLIILILLIVLLFIPSLSKYLSEASSVFNADISRWEIKVNTQSIKDKQDFSQVFVPKVDYNENIDSGVIAPGSSGNFTIQIDFTNVDVSAVYNINLITKDENSKLKDLIVYKYQLPNGTEKNTDSTNNTNLTLDGKYSYVKGSTEGKIQEYIFYYKWNDDPTTELMNNTEDTNTAILNEDASQDTNNETKISIKINFQQTVN